MNPLGDRADGFLSRLSGLPEAGNAHDALSVVVFEALSASGLRAERASRFDLGFSPERAPVGIADLAIEVKTHLRGRTDFRRYAEDLAVDLRDEDEIERLLVLYAEGPPSGIVRLDFDPGPLRFRRLDEFIERLRDDHPLEVISSIDREGQDHYPVVGEVVEVGSADGTVTTVRPLGEDTAPVYLQIGEARSAPSRPGEQVLFEYRLPFDAKPARTTAVAALLPDLAPGPAVKHIGIWVEKGGERMRGPLAAEAEYVMRFKVGDLESATVLEGEETEVPLSDIPEQGLDTTWTVHAERLAFSSESPVTPVDAGHDVGPTATVSFPLHIPRERDSATVDVPFTAADAGRVTVHVEIRAADRVYRRLSAELEIAGSAAPDPSAVTVNSDTTYMRADSIAELPPREHYFVDIRVIDGHAIVTGHLPDGRRPNKILPWTVNTAELDAQVVRVRAAVESLRQNHDPYLNDLAPESLEQELAAFDALTDWTALPDQSDEGHRQAWEVVSASDELEELAAAGHMLYDTVFPGGSEIRGWIDALPSGSRLTIQWAQSAAPADVPWGLFYRPRLSGDIDPMGFLGLGLRLVHYAYEPQTPANAFLGEPEQATTALCLFWGSEPAISREAGRQRQELDSAPGVVFVPTPEAVEPRGELLEYLQTPGPQAPVVLYFFCQYGRIPPDDEGLRFGDDNGKESLLSTLTLGGAEVPGAPFVFANACATGGQDAYHASQIKRHFLTHGGWAYLGTETKVPVELASRFATVFFRIFRRRDDGGSPSAGEALSQTRLFLWTRYRNLGGLLYSYVNEPDLRLAARPGGAG